MYALSFACDPSTPPTDIYVSGVREKFLVVSGSAHGKRLSQTIGQLQQNERVSGSQRQNRVLDTGVLVSRSW